MQLHSYKKINKISPGILMNNSILVPGFALLKVVSVENWINPVNLQASFPFNLL